RFVRAALSCLEYRQPEVGMVWCTPRPRSARSSSSHARWACFLIVDYIECGNSARFSLGLSGHKGELPERHVPADGNARSFDCVVARYATDNFAQDDSFGESTCGRPKRIRHRYRL